MTTTTRTITIPSQLDPVAVFGPVDEVIRQVEHAFPDLTIIVRGDRVAIVSHSKSTESQASRAEDVIHTIIQAAYSAPMDADTVRRLLDQDVLPNKVRAEHLGYGRSAERGRASLGAARSGDARKPRIPGVITFAAGQPVRAKTAGQIAYVNAVDAHTITFAIGPAGTGKTYLAVAKAVRAFQDRRIRRIILTRPAVEAGRTSVSSPARSTTRSTLICARCMTRCPTCSAPTSCTAISTTAPSRSRRSRTCADARSTTPT